MQHKGTRLRQVNVCLCVFRTLQVGQKPEVPCMSHCNCYTSSVSPVCGSNGVTYLSSCFAGCTRAIGTGLPPPPRSQVITHLISNTAFVSHPFFPIRCHTLSLYGCFSRSPLISWTAHVQRGSLELKPTSLIRYTVCRKGHRVLPARHLNGHCNMGLCTHYHTKRMVQTGIDDSKTTVTNIIIIEHWLTT